MIHKNTIELLAPCGNFESLCAAVQNGADAVYMGGFKFGARSQASRNSDDELIRSIAYAHERGVKCYITVNTLIRNDELEECMEYILFLQQAGADAIILQDIGLAYLVHKNYPNLEIHASTQTASVNRWDAIVLRHMGFSRLVAARESSLEEVQQIQKASGLEMEVFAHGALCVSYSGRCLFSFFQGGRSGNRGECAQSCRMEYRTKQCGILSDSSYALSPKDLRVLEHLQDISTYNIASLKIEGRLRRPEYVAVVVGAYRKALDAMSANQEIDIHRLVESTEKVFNRGSTKGYLLHEQGSKIINSQSPKNQGVPVAKVLEINRKRKRLKIKVLDNINKGDGLSTGEFVGRILKGEKIISYALAGEVVELDYIGSIKPGATIYKTFDHILMKEAQQSITTENCCFPLEMEFSLALGELAKLVVWDERGNKIVHANQNIVGEKAVKKALEKEVLYKGLSKLGGTPYVLNHLEVHLDDISTISMSDINTLRKEAVLKLVQMRQGQHFLAADQKIPILQSLHRERPNGNKSLVPGIRPTFSGESAEIQWAVRCRTKEQLLSLKDFSINRIYVDEMNLYHEGCKIFGDDILYFSLPTIARERDQDEILRLVDQTKGRYLVNSLGLLDLLKDCHTVADYGMNLYNKYSWDLVQSDFVTPSLEILFSQNYTQLNEAWNKKNIEIPLFLTPLLMVSEFCPDKNATGHCKHHNCKGNERFFVNKKEQQFPIGYDAFCRSLIYQHKPESLEYKIEEFTGMGFCHFRLEFLKENPDEMKAVMKRLMKKTL